jgi:pimeloyl-ACP methyl ester carboxylesterase
VRRQRQTNPATNTAQNLVIRQFLLTNLVRDPETGLQRFKIPLGILGPALNHMGDFHFKEPHVARYDGPALFIRGLNSPYVPDDILPLIGEFFPRFELRDVDSGHWVISEKPDDFRKGE